MLKASFIITILLLLPFTSYAAAGTAVPAVCLTDTHGTGVAAVARRFNCVSVDKKNLSISKNYSFDNVCVFKDGMWQIGKYSVAKGTQAVAFRTKAVCTHGVEVVQPETSTSRVIGPTKMEVYNGCLGSNGFDAADDKKKKTIAAGCGKDFQASYAAAPSFKAGDVILSCFRGTGNSGVERDSVLCARTSSEQNYCNLEDISTGSSSTSVLNPLYKKNFSGKWFVQYTKAGHLAPRICMGGVTVSNINDANSEYGNDTKKAFNDTVTGTTNLETLTSIKDKTTSDSVTLNFSGTPADTVQMVGCKWTNAKSQPIYTVCKNEDGCARGEDCSVNSTTNTTQGYQKGDCFFGKNGTSSARWWVVTKNNKKKVGSEAQQCSEIDISSAVRDDAEAMHSNQSNFNISTLVNASTSVASVSIGQSDNVANRKLQIGYDSSTEVVGVGLDPLVTVCPLSGSKNDCSKFKVQPSYLIASQTSTQGVLAVGQGALFKDYVNFEKDIVVTGAMLVNDKSNFAKDVNVGGNITTSKDISVTGSIAVVKNVTVTGTVTAASDGRYKTNIRHIDHALEKISNLNGIYYNFDSAKFPEKQFSDANRIGLIAQDVRKEFPEAVVEDSTGFLSVAYGDLVGPLVEAVKELYQKMKSDGDQNRLAIEKLRADMNALRSENESLKNRIQKIESGSRIK